MDADLFEFGIVEQGRLTCGFSEGCALDPGITALVV
jgi:hypothetical protein